MRVELLSRTMDAETTCAVAASICHGSADKFKALRSALGCGHDSVAEHESFTFYITGVSRVALAQLTRSRIASFTVAGQRYNVVDENAIYVPDTIMRNNEAQAEYMKYVHECFLGYKSLMEKYGIHREDARYILPGATTCDVVMTVNARELLHFLEQRQCNRAQKEIRDIADEMALIAKSISPIIFKNAGPGCVRGSCPEGKLCCRHPRTDLIEEDTNES